MAIANIIRWSVSGQSVVVVGVRRFLIGLIGQMVFQPLRCLLEQFRTPDRPGKGMVGICHVIKKDFLLQPGAFPDS